MQRYVKQKKELVVAWVLVPYMKYWHCSDVEPEGLQYTILYNNYIESIIIERFWE